MPQRRECHQLPPDKNLPVLHEGRECHQLPPGYKSSCAKGTSKSASQGRRRPVSRKAAHRYRPPEPRSLCNLQKQLIGNQRFVAQARTGRFSSSSAFRENRPKIPLATEKTAGAPRQDSNAPTRHTGKPAAGLTPDTLLSETETYPDANERKTYPSGRYHLRLHPAEQVPRQVIAQRHSGCNHHPRIVSLRPELPACNAESH